MVKKLVLADLLDPFIKKEKVVFKVDDEEFEFEFGIRPPSDQFDFAQIEALERIQEDLGWDDEKTDKYIKQRNATNDKVKARIDEILKGNKNPTTEDYIQARLKVRTEEYPYSITDTKYNVRWNRFVIPLQIRFLVIDPETKQPMFDSDDKILSLPREQREAISDKLEAYLLKRSLGVIEAKKSPAISQSTAPLS